MIRLFAALPIPKDIGLALARRQTGVEGALWVPPRNLHVTLRFFGNLREDVARDLSSELAQIDLPPFEVALSGAGSFGEGTGLRAVWVGVVESEPLRRLAHACEKAAGRAGLSPARRNFRPHVTLAHLRHANPTEVGRWVQSNNLLKSPLIAVESFALLGSELGIGAPHFQVEAEFRL